MDPTLRQQRLLEAIIHEYIRTARPVSSLALAEEYGFDFSPATIRNDMAELEEQGLITQPHTSAGRVPTERGYHFYIQHFLHDHTLPKVDRSKLQKVTEQSQQSRQYTTEHLRQVARTIADITGETVFIAFQNGDYVIAGLSALFQKPDFAQMEQLLQLSEAFDHLDEVAEHARRQLTQAVKIFIGQENPFSAECALIVATFAASSQHVSSPNAENILGIVGPMRMNYERNIAIINYLDYLLHERH